MLKVNVFFFSLEVPVNGEISTEVIRSERDAWVNAINTLCMEWKDKSQSEHVYEELKESTKLKETIKECQSECETAPENEREQISQWSGLVPPLPKPRSMLDPTRLPALGPESKLPSTPVKTPQPDPAAQKSVTPHEVSNSTLIPAPPAPPPLPKKDKAKPLTERTKAFHWDLITQDKVLLCLLC